MAVSGVILNGVSLSTCLPVYLFTCLPVCLPVYLSTFLPECLTVYLPVLRGGVDPNQVEDSSGHAHFLFLHLWPDGPGWACLLAERLEETAGGCLCTSLPLLCLQLVSQTFKIKDCFVTWFLFTL